MNKKILISFIVSATLFSSAVSAAPLTDYSAGRTSIDLTWRTSKNTIEANGHSVSLDNKYNLDWGITTGLGHDFALQIAGYDAKSKDTLINMTVTAASHIKTTEYNVLYKLNKNIAAYTGVVNLKGTMDNHMNIGGYSMSQSASGSENKVQFGLIGSTKIAAKTSVYGQVGVASDLTNWKVGVAQEIAPNVDFNIDYRYLSAKKLTLNATDPITGNPITANTDCTTKGIGFGISYKF